MCPATDLGEYVLPDLGRREPVLVVGAAPCLENHPKAFLKGFTSIGVNCAGFYFDPDFLLWSDTNLVGEPYYTRMLECYDGVLLLKNQMRSSPLADRKGGPTVFFQHFHDGQELEGPFCDDPNALEGNFSATQMAVELARRMNPSGIYTVGVEYRYVDGVGCISRPQVFGVERLTTITNEGGRPHHDGLHVLETHAIQGKQLLQESVDVGKLDPESLLPDPWKLVDWDYIRSMKE